VDLEFSLSNAHTDLVDQGFDVAVRATANLRDSSLVVRKLGELAHGLYASPSYLRKHGVPTRVADLEHHRCIVFRGKDLVRTWALRDAAGEAATEVHGRVGGDDFSFVRAMMLRGAGIGLCPMVLCRRDEEEGKLVRVLPGFSARGATLYVLYPTRHKVPARVTAFRDFVVDAFSAWANGRT
jgi:DNA-binding transcriptional LysR family regulator